MSFSEAVWRAAETAVAGDGVPDLSPLDKVQALCSGLDHSHNLSGRKLLLEVKEVGLGH